MSKKIDIYKSAGLIIQGRKVLVTRTRDKEHFIHPGGKLLPGENSKQALVRELKEELGISVGEDDLKFFDHNSAQAAYNPEMDVHMDVFIVTKWRGHITPDNEIEEIRWLTSDVPKGITLGSIMLHETIPKLRAENLID